MITVDCACGNKARYIDEDGKACCGVCPIVAKKDAIRISDVPRLLAWCRRYLDAHLAPRADRDELREIVGRKPT